MAGDLNPPTQPRRSPNRDADGPRNIRPGKAAPRRSVRLFWLILFASLGTAALIAAGSSAYLVSRSMTLQWSGSSGQIDPNILGGEANSSQAPSAGLMNPEGTLLPPLPGQGPGAKADIPPARLTPWDRSGRVTVLLLGLDYRDWEDQTDASRSDTMILLTMDPQTKTAGILSIPRDLWVPIPGFKHGKINTAYYLGDAYKMPGGGPALAVKTVENFLGVPINYYAQVDFSTFVTFIDQIGGITVDVPAPIKIDMLGDGPRTIKTLKAGKQVLPGAYALAYARNRHTENGDFDRAARQQQVIMGIRDRILRFDMLPGLIQKAPTLYSQLSSGIRTNLTLDEVLQLALLAQSVPEEKIARGIIDKDMVAFGFSPDGLSILVPYSDDVQALRDRIFAGTGSLAPMTAGDAQAQMKAEAARVTIYNASSDSGFGQRVAAYLQAQGVVVAQTAAADRSSAMTIITDHRGAPFAMRYLVELLKIPATRIHIDFKPGADWEIALVVGDDLLRSGVIP